MSLITKLFPELDGKWQKANFNEVAKKLIPKNGENPFIDPYKCNEMVKMLHKRFGVDYSYGGWMEDREELWRGHYHLPGKTIHVGVDYSVPLNTKVAVPVNCELVDAMDDPDKFGGWGGRLVFKTENNLYFLFAHLKNIAKAGRFQAGDVVAAIAEPEKNGGWYPHLHVQCMPKLDLVSDAYLSWYKGIETDFPDPEKELTWQDAE